MGYPDRDRRKRRHIRPQPAQEAFMGSSADICIFGGAAGGGKSFSLILEPLRHIKNAAFGGVIFRRTSPELTGAGSLWELAGDIYPSVDKGVRLRENPRLLVEFSTGASIEFTHLQYVSDAKTHHGKQYAFIGFDELTHFEEEQFWYLISRMRTTCGIQPYMRCTCNPDPDSFVRQLIDWWIDDNGNVIEERSGVLRWFVRRAGTLEWGDTRDELLNRFGAECEPLSMTFIGAKLEDNPALVAADPGYRSRLEALPEIDQARLLGGNWNVRAEGGKYIPRECFAERWEDLPERLNIYMASDFAVTEPEKPSDDPDYTEHGVFGLADDGRIYILDWWYGQTTSDIWIESLIDLWATHKPLCWFGEGGVIRRAIEPALLRRMRERRVFSRIEWLSPQGGRQGHGSSKEGFADRSKQAKAIRARAFQAMAHNKRIIFPKRASWLSHVLELVINFPAKGHDDPLDVISMMCNAIDTAHPGVQHSTSVDRPTDGYSRRSRRPKSWRTA